MSAIAETPDGPVEVIQVLFALHPGFGAQEVVGPLEVLSQALHRKGDPGMSAYLNIGGCEVVVGGMKLGAWEKGWRGGRDGRRLGDVGGERGLDVGIWG